MWMRQWTPSFPERKRKRPMPEDGSRSLRLHEKENEEKWGRIEYSKDTIR